MLTIGECQYTAAPLDADDTAGEQVGGDVGEASLDPVVPTQCGKWKQIAIMFVVSGQRRFSS